MIIYLAIVGMILVSLTFLIIDIIGGQTKSVAGQEVNQNMRFISNNLVQDIRSAQDFSIPSSDTLILTLPGDDITYVFDSGSIKLTRQLGAASPIDVNSTAVEVSGSFFDWSFQARTKNVGVSILVNYKNPGNRPDFNASTTSSFSLELRGRR